MTERSQRTLKHTVCRSCQLSAKSIAKDLQTWCDLQISTTLHRERHGMDFHGRAAARLKSPSAMQGIRCSGVKPMDS
ncbi:unnamed protein product, partial [Staurois parvus]